MTFGELDTNVSSTWSQMDSRHEERREWTVRLWAGVERSYGTGRMVREHEMWPLIWWWMEEVYWWMEEVYAVS